MKAILLIAASALTLLLFSCEEPPKPQPPAPPPVTDTTPVGDGLKVVGYALLGAAVVITVGRAVSKQ